MKLRRKKTSRCKQYKPPENPYKPENFCARCSECPLRHQGNQVPTKRPICKTKLAVLGEAPGPLEEKRGEYFVGPSGEELDKALYGCGVSRDEIHINNALQCRPKKRSFSNSQWKKALQCCWPRLEKELLESGAEVVIGLGKWAQYALRGKTDPIHDWCGSIYPVESPFCTTQEIATEKERKLQEWNEKNLATWEDWHTRNEKRVDSGKKHLKIPKPKTPPSHLELKQPVQQLHAQCITTYHPAFALRQKRQYLPVIYEHFERAWDLANGSLQPWKWPKIYAKDNKEAMDALRQMWEDVQSGNIDRLGMDIETNGSDPCKDSMTKVGLSSKDVAISLSWPLRKDAGPIVRALLAHHVAKAAHNGTHDLIGFEKVGYEVNGYKYDTIIQKAIWTPTLLHRLQFACSLNFHCPAWKKEFSIGGEEKGLERFLRADPLELGIYNAKDAYMTLLLSYALEDRMRAETENWEELYRGYLARSLISKEMRKKGVMVDRKRIEEHITLFYSKCEETQEAFKALAREVGYPEEAVAEINLRSPLKNKKFFFEHMKASTRKKSEKTGLPSLDEDALQLLSLDPDEHLAKAAVILREFRRWDKLIGFLKKLHNARTKVIHADGKCYATKTGRWAYTNPNLTTIPKAKYKKGPDGELIEIAPSLRDIIIARPGLGLVEVDFSSLEVRIMAYLTGDELLIDWLESGKDIHMENAKIWFGTSTPNKFQRSLAKMLVYAMNYGGGANTIWRNLSVDYPGLQLEDIEYFIKVWYMHHPKIRVFQKNLMKVAEEEGVVRIPLSGKTVNVHGDLDPPKIYNPPIQGTGAALIDRAIEKVWERCAHEEGETILIQVHDALIGESPDPMRLGRLFKEEMEKPVELNGRTVSFPTDCKIGPNWSEMKEVQL